MNTGVFTSAGVGIGLKGGLVRAPVLQVAPVFTAFLVREFAESDSISHWLPPMMFFVRDRAARQAQSIGRAACPGACGMAGGESATHWEMCPVNCLPPGRLANIAGDLVPFFFDYDLFFSNSICYWGAAAPRMLWHRIAIA